MAPTPYNLTKTRTFRHRFNNDVINEICDAVYGNAYPYIEILNVRTVKRGRKVTYEAELLYTPEDDKTIWVQLECGNDSTTVIWAYQDYC